MERAWVGLSWFKVFTRVVVVVAMRNDPLMCEMKALHGSAVWMLVAGRLKAHSQQRSRAAQELQDIAYPRRPGNRRH